MERGPVETTNIIKALLNQVFTEVYIINDDELIFHREDGYDVVFYHDQDCCECVWIEEVCGDLSFLANTPILMAEEYIHEQQQDEKWHDYYTYTFYKFATIKGYVTVMWRGESNGYYSESVDMKVI